MPTFSSITLEVSADIDFEVYCGVCGAGLCNVSSTRESRNRKYPQVTVEPCEACIETAKESAREEAEKEYQQRIEELEERLNEK